MRHRRETRLPRPVPFHANCATSHEKHHNQRSQSLTDGSTVRSLKIPHDTMVRRGHCVRTAGQPALVVAAREVLSHRWLNGSSCFREGAAFRAMADRVAAMRSEPDPDRDDAILRRCGFDIPTDAALDEVAVRSTGGVVELGAGVGYWAHHLSERGVDVIAYDIEPPPERSESPVRRIDALAPRSFEATSAPWSNHADRRGRTRRLLCDSRRVPLRVDGPGGRTGDPTFHAVEDA